MAVEADRQVLAAIVSNLLQNAFKFTRAKGRVTLRTHVREGRILIEVEDECGGLPQGRVEELFRPFEQRGANRTGLGLGLAISRTIAEKHGGELSLTSRQGEGTTVTLRLPYAYATRMAP